MNKTRVLVGALLAVSLLTLSGCSSIDSTPEVKEKTPEPMQSEYLGKVTSDQNGAYRYVDNETGVVCYVVQDSGPDTSIDCVELEDSNEQ